MFPVALAKLAKGFQMKKVRDILQSKNDDGIFCIDPNAMIVDGLRIMAEKGVGALLVRENGVLVGIMSERDYTRKVALNGLSSHSTDIRQIMTTHVITVSPGHTMEECMELMTDKRIRHLPVMEDGKLLGMISIGDLVKNIIEDQKNMIRQLEQYIRGETI
jgi:CBS domain-containing protein